MTQLDRRRLIGLTCACMTQHGLVLTLLGPVLPAVMETFHIEESAAGVMFGLGGLGFALGPMIAGTIADRVGAKWILLLGLTVEVLMLSSFGLVPSFLLVVAVNLILHAAGAFIETSVNILPVLIDRQRAGSLMNRIHLFFSVGAFIAPFAAGLILETTGNWRPVFWLSALPTALLVLFTMRVTFPLRVARDDPMDSPPIPIGKFLRQRSILLGALAIGLYVGAEVGVGGWIVLYLQRRLGFATLTATSGLSIMWMGLIVGRYLNSVLAEHYSSRVLVVGAGVGGLIAGLALLTARTPLMAYIWLGAIGLCMSGVFPNIMAELNAREPARAGAVSGFLAAAAAVGAMVMQPILGSIAQWLGLTVAIAMPAFLMGLTALAYLGVKDARPENARAG